jgi:hypothetical protein
VALMAYRATVDAKSADITSSFVSSTGNGTSATETGAGVFSWSTNTGELTYRTSVAANAVVDTDDIFEGRVVYTRILAPGLTPGLAGSLNTGEWSESTWSGTSDLGLFASLFFGSPGPPSPGTILQMLKSDASSTSVLGTESIDGIETTHYRALIPLENLGVGKPTPRELRSIEQITGTTSLAVNFWVDSSQLLRRLSFGLTVRELPPPPAGSQSLTTPGELPFTMTDTINMVDYGVPVDVTAPPASEVTPGASCHSNSSGFTCESSL